MKLCTKARVTGHHTGEDGREIIDDLEIIDLSLVDDTHTPGFDLQGFLHFMTPPGAGSNVMEAVSLNG